jgi:hypothetical protein
MFECYFIEAVAAGDISKIKEFVRKGIGVGQDNNQALKTAIEFGNLDVVKYLINEGCNPRMKVDEILGYGIAFERIEIVKYLIKVGCDLANLNIRHLTHAHINKFFKVIKRLLKMDASLVKDKEYMLLLAVNYGSIEIVKHLVDNLDEYQIEKYTLSRCLRQAIIRNHFEIVKFLMKSEFDTINTSQSENIWTQNTFPDIFFEEFVRIDFVHKSNKIYFFLLFILTKRHRYFYLQRYHVNRLHYLAYSKLCAPYKEIILCQTLKTHNMLKYVLKPMSLHMQLTSIE